jgi:hypothetical protein
LVEVGRGILLYGQDQKKVVVVVVDHAAAVVVGRLVAFAQ